MITHCYSSTPGEGTVDCEVFDVDRDSTRSVFSTHVGSKEAAERKEEDIINTNTRTKNFVSDRYARDSDTYVAIKDLSSQGKAISVIKEQRMESKYMLHVLLAAQKAYWL